MKQSYPLNSFLFIFTLLLSSLYSLNAQDNYKIVDAYEDYTDAAREVAYLHLNKSTYIKGEDIGFTAYVLDKTSKTPSLLTTNLYVTIEDENKNTIKQQLIRVENGVASNVIEIDSSFSSGYYNIKAYTNWMRNFDEQNYFIEPIQIIDQNEDNKKKASLLKNEMDAQFLPEGGHLLNGVINKIGVVLKDTNGYGIPNAKGTITDKNSNLITTFEVNKAGIGNFLLLPELTNQYKININYLNKDFVFELKQKIEKTGISLSLAINRNKATVSLTTNKESYNLIKDQAYTLALHNGSEIITIAVAFSDKTNITKAFDLKTLSPGINIITLFNKNYQPIAERLFFNYNGIKIIKSSDLNTTTVQDSLSIKLNFKTINTQSYNNISISVLPQESTSYNSNHNLISYTYLQPYINSNVENGKYYFTNINDKKKNELDNLLITQGWSSYNWNNIFNETPNLPYNFEQGIDVKANLLSKDIKIEMLPNNLMYHINKSNYLISKINDGESYYTMRALYPITNDTLKLSRITTKEGLRPAKLYLQFSPSTIPSLHSNNKLMSIGKQKTYETENNYNNIILSKGVEMLDEVIVKSNPVLEKYEKRNKLSIGRLGKVKVISEQDRRLYSTLYDYIQYEIFTERERTFDFQRAKLKSTDKTTPDVKPMGSELKYYLDDNLHYDNSFIKALFMEDIEFIEYDRFGLTGGITSPNGTLKIYTKKTWTNKSGKKTSQNYQFPLAFATNKTYYTPKYKYLNDSFYKKYGVISWAPNLQVDNDNNITIKVYQPKVPITLHIEGLTSDGSIIIEEKIIPVN